MLNVKHLAGSLGGIVMTALLASAAAHAQPPREDPFVHVLPEDAELWEFTQILGNDGAITSEEGVTSHVLTLEEFDAFGYYETDKPTSDTIALNGNILVADWVVGTSADNPENVPDFRLRLSAKDGTYTQAYLIQDAFTSDGHESPTVPAAGEPKTYRTLSYIPQSARNGVPSEESDGFVAALDILEFKGTNDARLGESVFLEAVAVQVLQPNSFGGGPPIFILNRDLGQDAERDRWTASGDDVGGQQVEHIADSRGIGIRTFGELGEDPIGTPFDTDFYFGWWGLEDAFTAEAGKFYRVNWVVEVDSPDSDTDDVQEVVPSRLRIQNDKLDYVATAVAGANILGDVTNNPDSAGKEFFTWLTFPEGLDGEPVDLFFDVWQSEEDLPEGTTIILKQVQIKDFNAPIVIED